MKTILTIVVCFYTLLLTGFSQDRNSKSATVSMVLDHNRMLVDAEIQKNDGTWRKVKLWIDSGSPSFSMSEALAADLSIDLSTAKDPNFKGASLEIPPPENIRIGGMNLNFKGVKSKVAFHPFWLFFATGNDATLPSTVLKKYQIIFDYPNRKLTIAEPGTIKPKGVSSPANVHPQTGIIQMNALVNGDSCSFALDMGASYSFISEGKLAKLSEAHPEWPRMTGTLGCANMWGWWPENEQLFQVVRIPEIKWGNVQLENVGIVGVPNFSPNGPTLGEWYSRKTVRPVDGFLGANVLKDYRIEIDYANSTVYFEKGQQKPEPEMDMVGISVRPLPDGNFQVVGIVQCDGKLVAEGIFPDDIIVSVNGSSVKGKTMGTVVDMLRGTPGEKRNLVIERNGQQFNIEAKVERFL